MHLNRISNYLQWRYQNWVQPINTCRGVFSNFEDAIRSAPAIKKTGYDNAQSEQWYEIKFTNIRIEDYASIYWLEKILPESETLFELGGHTGVAYYGYKKYLHYHSDLKWTICDVPSIVEKGKSLALEKGASQLNFVSEIEKSGPADIFMANGALQYLENSLLENLMALPSIPKHVLLNMTPIHPEEDFITLQNIGRVYCPYHIFSKQKIIKELAGAGLELVDWWSIDRAFVLPGHQQKSFKNYSGCYFRRAEK